MFLGVSLAFWYWRGGKKSKHFLPGSDFTDQIITDFLSSVDSTGELREGVLSAGVIRNNFYEKEKKNNEKLQGKHSWWLRLPGVPPRPPQTSKMGNFITIVKDYALNYFCKVAHYRSLRVSWIRLWLFSKSSENSLENIRIGVILWSKLQALVILIKKGSFSGEHLWWNSLCSCFEEFGKLSAKHRWCSPFFIFTTLLDRVPGRMLFRLLFKCFQMSYWRNC